MWLWCLRSVRSIVHPESCNILKGWNLAETTSQHITAMIIFRSLGRTNRRIANMIAAQTFWSAVCDTVAWQGLGYQMVTKLHIWREALVMLVISSCIQGQVGKWDVGTCWNRWGSCTPENWSQFVKRLRTWERLRSSVPEGNDYSGQLFVAQPTVSKPQLCIVQPWLPALTSFSSTCWPVTLVRIPGNLWHDSWLVKLKDVQAGFNTFR